MCSPSLEVLIVSTLLLLNQTAYYVCAPFYLLIINVLINYYLIYYLIIISVSVIANPAVVGVDD